MVMNTQQLFYLTEIERTRSISQAAENLYMSQPNFKPRLGGCSPPRLPYKKRSTDFLPNPVFCATLS